MQICAGKCGKHVFTYVSYGNDECQDCGALVVTALGQADMHECKNCLACHSSSSSSSSSSQVSFTSSETAPTINKCQNLDSSETVLSWLRQIKGETKDCGLLLVGSRSLRVPFYREIYDTTDWDLWGTVETVCKTILKWNQAKMITSIVGYGATSKIHLRLGVHTSVEISVIDASHLQKAQDTPIHGPDQYRTWFFILAMNHIKAKRSKMGVLDQLDINSFDLCLELNMYLKFVVWQTQKHNQTKNFCDFLFLWEHLKFPKMNLARFQLSLGQTLATTTLVWTPAFAKKVEHCFKSTVKDDRDGQQFFDSVYTMLS